MMPELYDLCRAMYPFWHRYVVPFMFNKDHFKEDEAKETTLPQIQYPLILEGSRKSTTDTQNSSYTYLQALINGPI